jgi:hypothetical protein
MPQVDGGGGESHGDGVLVAEEWVEAIITIGAKK